LAAGDFLMLDLRWGDEERKAIWFEPVLSVSAGVIAAIDEGGRARNP
jgi:hypothetical protein